MIIQKYIKDKQNKYKVIIDDNEYTLYDDIIIKYSLISKKEIDVDTFKKIISENDELVSYYDSIKYINKKLRSEKEIREYLNRKGIIPNVIDKTIEKLKKTSYLNDDIYFKAYIQDQLNLTNNGPKKIEKKLLSLGFTLDKIHDYLDNINESVWNNKINNYIDKKIKSNHNNSIIMLKRKIVTDLINLGYDKELIVSILNTKNINDDEILKHEYLKIKKSLEKKYEGYELDKRIKMKLYSKGFNVNDLTEVNYEE